MAIAFIQLGLATVLFVGSHFLLSGMSVRNALIGKMGERGFMAFYSVVAFATIYWMVASYSNAPYVSYWDPPTAVKHLTLSFMVVVAIFIVAALTPKNPTMAGATKDQLSSGPVGIFRITRHPMMWGVAIWGILHILAASDFASLIFFGGMVVLALGGTAQIDRRKANTLGAEWQTYAAQSSHIPFAAIVAKQTTFSAKEIGWLPVILGFGLYLVLLILHETLFGIAPMSWVSGLFD